MSQAPHLCFFSTKNRLSQDFLEALSQTPYSKEFKFICVDQQPGRPRPQLPGYVKAVPTLMIQGESEPRVDIAVMNWISERRLTDRPQTRAGGAAPAAGGPEAFTSDMGCLGDEGFCMIGEEGAGMSGRLAGGMVSFDSPMMGGPPPGSNPATTANMMGGSRGGPGMSAKAKALDDAMTRLMQERSMGIPQPIARR
jgi:hypothetical protein